MSAPVQPRHAAPNPPETILGIIANAVLLGSDEFAITYSRGYTAVDAVGAFTPGFDQLGQTRQSTRQQAIVNYYRHKLAEPIERQMARGLISQRCRQARTRRSSFRPTT